MKRLLVVVLLAAVLVGCAGFGSNKATPTAAEQAPWWETAVFYEIFVRSFYDTDGDGIGDFNGITAKLDYLQDLGVNAIWLMPIHPSPSYHGYDVINYFNVNPQYGSMEDFKRLLDAVHQRNMYLIIDLVINHTSNKNPWFVDSNSSLEAAYRNWYIWSISDPGYSGPLGYPWHPGKNGYYYGVFSDTMPDLNYNNPEVSTGMLKVVDFWLSDIGVDGFRVDAVKYLIEEGQKQENTASSHVWLEKFYTAYKATDPSAFTVGEVWGAGAFSAKTYENELDEIFSFELAGGFVNSAQGESNTAMNSAVQFTLKDLPNGPLATFLTNHDQNRVMSVMAGNVDKAKVAAGLMLTSPGTVFIYYGEEIGMEGVKPDEDIRRPMQWNSEANAGFTTGTPWRDVGTNYPQANVVSETGDANSLLSYYKTFLSLRNQNPTFKTGSLVMVSTDNTGVYAALRNDDPGVFLVVVNLTKNPISEYSLASQGSEIADGTYALQALYGTEADANLSVVEHSFIGFVPLAELSPYSVYVYQLAP
ncbi:MAG: alpha-amylase [Anaerolineales bacterium]|nr:alpha-amylase [Anaerolineae bacterium]PWB53225.1 MAG: alpha-amylase [Anaerolineales bacterium]